MLAAASRAQRVLSRRRRARGDSDAAGEAPGPTCEGPVAGAPASGGGDAGAEAELPLLLASQSSSASGATLMAEAAATPPAAKRARVLSAQRASMSALAAGLGEREEEVIDLVDSSSGEEEEEEKREDARPQARAAPAPAAAPAAAAPAPVAVAAAAAAAAAPVSVAAEGETLLGTVACKLVGTRYYRGVISPGESVGLVREPDNAYDAKAIRCDNVLGEQVGHIERDYASVLAPLLDAEQARLEAYVPANAHRDNFHLRVHIDVFAAPAHAAAVTARLRPYRFTRGGLPRTGSQWSGNFSSVREFEASHDRALAALAGAGAGEGGSVSDGASLLEAAERDLGAVFASGIALAAMPQCDGLGLATSLMPFQRQGLQWMTDREKLATLADEGCADFLFWRRLRLTNGQMAYVNVATNTVVRQAPAMPRGGVLADEMGLGKTLQVLALVTRQKLVDPTAAGRPTLVVCPLTLLSSWQDQLAEHVRPGQLSSLVYHGPQRARLGDGFADCDVVFTTYDVLRSELVLEGSGRQQRPGRQTSPLFTTHWLRVVLDEAHVIRERSTRQAKAALALNAERRWCLTGTPLNNKLDDAYTLFAFLRVEPFARYDWWTRLVVSALRRGSAVGLARVRELFALLCLRRCKATVMDGRPIVSLPPRTSRVIQVPLRDDERRMYDCLATQGGELFELLLDRGLAARNLAFVLVLLLRMRQACVHAALVPRELHTGFAALLASGGVRGGGGGGAGGFSSFDAATLDKLLAKLRESALGGEECAVCLSGIDSGTGVATPCAHVFCRPCMAQLAEAAREGRAVFQCPLCRQPLDEARLLDVAAGEALQRARDDAQRRAEEASKQAAPDDIAAALCARPSSKLEALLRYLREQPADAKTVVFSQWAQLLDLVAAMLAREGYECARLHGSLSQPERTRSLARFRSEPACRVLLATLQTGALGLNLTSASRVVIMDPWWAPALEDQACDRIHRLGQTRAVEIVRFVVPDSVEERVLSLQTQKRELVASVLDARAQPQRSVLRDIMHLFGRSSRARELAVS